MALRVEALGEGALPMPSLPGHLQLSQLRGRHLEPSRERGSSELEFPSEALFTRRGPEREMPARLSFVFLFLHLVSGGGKAPAPQARTQLSERQNLMFQERG